jgi:hypothetical protein
MREKDWRGWETPYQGREHQIAIGEALELRVPCGEVFGEERHCSRTKESRVIMKIGSTGLTGMQNWFDRLSLTDREDLSKNRFYSLQERFDDLGE